MDKLTRPEDNRASASRVHRTMEEIVLTRRKLSPDELHKVKKLQDERGERLEKLLIDLGFISEEELLSILSEYWEMETISSKDLPKEPVPLNSFSAKFLKQSRVLPINVFGDELVVAISDPGSPYAVEALELATGLTVKAVLAREKDILDAIDSLYGSGSSSMEQLIDELERSEPAFLSSEEEDVDHLRDMASEAPVIRLVNLLITRGLESRASDIHIEPFGEQLKVRYRIDGVLHDAESPPRRLSAAVVSRVKIMAKLNIAERRLPQDGRIKLKVLGREIDLRVSTLPTLFGESVVLRILDRSSVVLGLTSLGFAPSVLEAFENLIVKPYGMILVTGPTGSGKTTTLYSALHKINSPEKKIITIEDPVEYQLEGINQIQVKPQIGLSFANGLRSIVRQDPDVIMVGEIRDYETAEITVQSALTGHLVFSTLHTNDSAGAISRLIEMGVEDYLLTSSLLGILAQRLVRKICPSCREEQTASDRLLTEIGINLSDLRMSRLYSGRGCEECTYTGFVGRIGIYELLTIDDETRRAILAQADSNQIKSQAVKRGMKTLREDGWLKAKEGVTTLSEVFRVTQEE